MSFILAVLACVLVAVVYIDVVLQFVQGWIQPTDENVHSLISLFLLGVMVWKAPGLLLRYTGNAPAETPSRLGLGLLAAGLLSLFAATLLDFVFLKQVSLIVAVWGILSLYFNLRPTGYGFFLSFFLAQAVPWLIVIPLTLPLKVFATQISAGMAMMLGWPVTYTSNIIELEGLHLQVASPCSGLHSVLGLTFVWLLAGLTHQLRMGKVLLFLPVVWVIAILLNAFRLFLTIAWGVWIETASAVTAHDFMGYVAFAVGIIVLLWFSHRISKP